MSDKLKVVKNFILMRYLKKFKTREKLEMYQEKNVLAHMKYLKKHSPYFKDINVKNMDDFKKLPIMDKKVMMDHFDTLNCVGIKKDEALKIAINSEKTRNFDEKLNNISVGLSSGTSGARGLFIVSDEERALWAGGVLARFLPKKNIWGHKIAFFLRADNNLYETINSKAIQFRYYDIMKDMKDNLMTLNTYQPTILVAPPSVLLLIAKAQEENEIEIHPIKILSVAEVLTKEDEEYFKKVFHKKIIYQAYQCTEGFLGYVCECGSFHINEDVIFLEKDYIDENRFVPIVTDFLRKSQPIIRYRLNDILVEGNKTCPCGNPTMVIEKIEGREDDIFVFKGIETEQVIVFPDFISRCVIYVQGFQNYKVVEENENEITIYLDGMNDDIKKEMITEFERLAQRMHFICPKINFKEYHFDFTRKMKRVERKNGYERKDKKY